MLDLASLFQFLIFSSFTRIHFDKLQVRTVCISLPFFTHCVSFLLNLSFPFRFSKKVKVAQLCQTLRHHGLYSSWNSPGQNTGVGSLSLFQGIFPIQRSNPGLPYGMQIPYQLSHKGSPRILEQVAYPFSRGSSRPRNQTRVSCIAAELSEKPNAGSVYTQMFSFTRLVPTAFPHSPFKCVIACIIIPHYSLPNL